MPAYTADKGLETLGNKIIKADRETLSILKICYMFRAEAAVTDDKVIAGRCVRVDDRNWTVHKYDFLIEIARDVWDDASEEFQLALMDHELGHCGIRMDEDGQPGIDDKTNRIRSYCKMHDIEEFEDVLERHGGYHKSLRKFLAAFVEHKKAKKTEVDPDE